MILLPYRRMDAVAYAHYWAYRRNPAFYDFEEIGGDCTNFASQCLYAGTGVMNFTPTYGWYYRSADDRAPAWSGVEFFYNFLTRSEVSAGPIATASEACNDQKLLLCFITESALPETCCPLGHF